MKPLRATSSMLCSVALLTVTPPTNTGLSLAAGVSAPVRPTLKMTPSSSVSSSSAGNLSASAPRADVAVISQAAFDAGHLHAFGTGAQPHAVEPRREPALQLRDRAAFDHAQ